jgi:hypothetical protein
MAAILATLAGTKTVREAAREVGLGEARFAELRDRMLGGALATLEPKPPGVRAKVKSPEQVEIERLEAKLNELEIELYAASVREEIALAMPEVLERPTLPGGNRRERRRLRALAGRRAGKRGA